MGTHTLVTSGRSYLDIVDHARSLEQFSREAQGGSDNHARQEGKFSGSQLGFRVLSDRTLRKV